MMKIPISAKAIGLANSGAIKTMREHGGGGTGAGIDSLSGISGQAPPTAGNESNYFHSSTTTGAGARIT